jgi:hypothetical protein
MVERFNGRINELLQQTRFDTAADLEQTLLNYLKLYNHHIPQRAIDGKTPILALKDLTTTLLAEALISLTQDGRLLPPVQFRRSFD